MNGILLLNKPPKMTSHDCVNKVRRIFNTKKVGHLGTLDPDAIGVLPICINEATKVSQFLDKADKEYLALVSIGTSTTTEDSSGNIINKDESNKKITRIKIMDALNSFLGKQLQTPPMISAVKVNGKKLYEYARNNKNIIRPKREIIIHEIDLLSKDEIFCGKEITFVLRVRCSKGTYIRTLAVDIGRKLGYPSHLKRLIRTKSGAFSINNSFTFNDIEKGDYKLISIFDALNDYPKIKVNDNIKHKILNGQKLIFKYDNFTFIVFYDSFKNVLAIYQPCEHNKNLIKPVRVFRSE